MTRRTTVRATLAAIGLAVTSAIGAGTPAQADAMYPYIGELMNTGNDFCPRGWARTDGQLLAISSNSALFALIGTIYGGDGQTTFALPDLRGRTPIHQGSAPGFSSYPIGQKGGRSSVNVLVTNLPPHSHSVAGVQAEGNLDSPENAFLAGGTELPYHDGPPDAVMDPNMIRSSGGSVAMPIAPPMLGTTWCIATTGTFPSRN